MRINHQHQTVDIEPRDINFILPAYIRTYQYYMKGELPKEIVFPMYPSVPSMDGVQVPIRYISIEDTVARNIVEDGSNVPETEAEETEEDVDEAPPAPPKDESPAKAALKRREAAQPDRQPKVPASGDIGPGAHPDDIGNRDVAFERRIARDLMAEPKVREEEEIETDIEKPKEGA